MAASKLATDTSSSSSSLHNSNSNKAAVAAMAAARRRNGALAKAAKGAKVLYMTFFNGVKMARFYSRAPRERLC